MYGSLSCRICCGRVFPRRYCVDFCSLVAKREANEITEMRPCSDQEGREGEVLDWREEGRLSIGQEAREVREAVERGREMRKGCRPIPIDDRIRSLGSVIRLQSWASTPLPRGGVDAQKNAKM